MPSAFQPCHIAPAPVTTSHLPGPIPRAASVQKGKDGGRDVEEQQHRQDALLEHGGEPGPISEIVPKPGPRRRHPGLASRGPNSSG